jgi:hypothetical protein
VLGVDEYESCALRSDDTEASSTRLGASVRQHRIIEHAICARRSIRHTDAISGVRE